MKITHLFLILLLGNVLLANPVVAQEKIKPKDDFDTAYKPLILNMDEEGSKYIRFILWHQQWATTNNLRAEDADLRVNSFTRRARLLMYAQMNSRLLVLLHFGVNNLTNANLGSVASSTQSALFLHDAWVEYKFSDALFVGTGLHYFNGLTRLSSQSTLNFLGIDNPRPFAHWHSFGITDQFARHMGIYAKGTIDKFTYRVSVNSPSQSANSIGGATNGSEPTELIHINTVKSVDATSNKGDFLYQGYLSYHFRDMESTKLPYWVGSYLGEKQVFNVGAGFFYHPDGMVEGPVTTDNLDDYATRDVFHLAADLFYDNPINEALSLTAYASLISFDYGRNFVSRWSGTGTNLFAQAGLYLRKVQLMPYVMVQYGNYEGLADPLRALDLGLSYYAMGNNAKFSIEYHTVGNFAPEGGLDANNNPVGMAQLRMQAQIYF